MNKYMKFFLALCFGVIIATSSAHAQRSDSIAAVVNGDIITYTDLYDRMDLVIKSSGMPNTREFKEKLLPQVLTGLITETVEIQEAKRLNIDTSKEEIAEGFAKIAESNKMKSDQFSAILKKQGIKMATMDRQILAQLAWGKVVQSEIRPRVVLGDSDIESEMMRLKNREGQTEYSMAEIFLPFGDADEQAKTQKVAQDLAKQLSKDVQKFPAAAKQFSQNTSAANGGIIGWMTLDQMPAQMASVVKHLEARKISQAFVVDDGYMIVFIREKRVIDFGAANSKEAETELKIKIAKFKLKDDQADRSMTKQMASDFARDVTGCLDIVKRAATNKDIQLDNLEGTAQSLSSDIVAAVQSLNIGEAAQPITKDDEIVVPMLCGRTGGVAGNAPSALEMEVEQRMGLQRMDILQKRYLRDLISDAYIERRV